MSIMLVPGRLLAQKPQLRVIERVPVCIDGVIVQEHLYRVRQLLIVELTVWYMYRVLRTGFTGLCVL